MVVFTALIVPLRLNIYVSPVLFLYSAVILNCLGAPLG